MAGGGGPGGGGEGAEITGLGGGTGGNAGQPLVGGAGAGGGDGGGAVDNIVGGDSNDGQGGYEGRLAMAGGGALQQLGAQQLLGLPPAAVPIGPLQQARRRVPTGDAGYLDGGVKAEADAVEITLGVVDLAKGQGLANSGKPGFTRYPVAKVLELCEA